MMCQTELTLTRSAAVWAVFRRHGEAGANLEVVSREFGVPKNEVTGRVHDLLDCVPARLVYAGKGYCPYSHRYTKWWKAI